MAIEVIAQEIKRILVTKDAGVVCITGKWGVGKTYAWKSFIGATKGNMAKSGLQKYAYVSLFGVNGIDEFKNVIFQNTVKSSDAGIEPTLETLQANTTSVTTLLGRKLLPQIMQITAIKNTIGGLSSLPLLLVKDMIVCIDDIERRGEKLSLRDVFGLVSHLKEQKRCKVFLILNERELGKDEEEYKKYFEKTVDIGYVFDPTAEESAQIGIVGSDGVSSQTRDCCVQLGITNIRVMRKIQSAVQKVEPILVEFDRKVLGQAIQTLALLGWSVFEPGVAPAIDFVRNRSYNIFGRETENITEQEIRWGKVLDRYQFTQMDTFDEVLLQGLVNGYANKVMLLAQARELGNDANKNIAEESLANAWSKFHDSLDNDADEVTDTLFATSRDNCRYLNPPNLSSTVDMLKKLGRPDYARALIEHYLLERAVDVNVFDLQNSSFGDFVRDPDVREAFNRKLTSVAVAKNPSQILIGAAKQRGWNESDIEFLSTLTVPQFVELFKRSRGQELRSMLDGYRMLSSVSNSSIAMQEAVHHATEALSSIAAESTINKLRLKRVGV